MTITEAKTLARILSEEIDVAGRDYGECFVVSKDVAESQILGVLMDFVEDNDEIGQSDE
jgi:hypothetical protein